MRPPRGFPAAAVALLASLAAAPASGAGGTPPAAGPARERLSFLVVGDWGERTGCQARTARRMGERAAADPVDFVISTGDNFYPDGVRGVDDPKWRTVFEEVYAADSLQVPWLAVAGNHDYRGSVEAQLAYSRRGARWRMPGRHHAVEEALGDGTRALFAFVDTTPLVPGYRWLFWRYPELRGRSAEAELEWLERTLASSDAAWKIVVGHHTVFSGGDHGATRALREALPPLFERHGVQLYLGGHEHSLQHLHPPGATHYVVSGGGATPREARPTPATLFARGACGFVAARLVPDALHLEFVDADGAVLHRAAVPRDGARP